MKACRLVPLFLLCAFLAGTLIMPSGAYTLSNSADISYAAAKETMVLLKNDHAALPLTSNDKIALFGEGQVFTDGKTGGFFLMGRGSGYFTLTETPKNPCDVLAAYVTKGKLGGVYTALSDSYKNAAKAAKSETDFTYSPTDAQYAAAAAYANKAIYIVNRTSAEGKDLSITEFGLTAAEQSELRKVCASFAGKPVIVVLNSGAMINCGFAFGRVDGIYADAVITAPYMGIRGVDVLCETLIGDVNPSGKTVDTYAKALTDYPSCRGFYESKYDTYYEDIFVGYRYFETFGIEVDYPFGYGLSYTTFDMRDYTYSESDGEIVVSVLVTNTGTVPGKEVVQLYFSAPQKGDDGALLSKPAKELCAFGKTKLLKSGESQTVTLSFRVDDMASYDDLGVTGHTSAYVMEAGDYLVYAGNSVKNVTKVGVHTEKSIRVTKQCSMLCEPTTAFERMTFDGTEKVGTVKEDSAAMLVHKSETAERIYPIIPITVSDVCEGKATLSEFFGQMSDAELIEFAVQTRALGVSAGTGAWGTSPDTAEKYQIPVADTADGPAGLRVSTKGTGIPGGAALACTWNADLIASLGTMIGKEARISGVDAWLAPGVNIHRFPLCGRNFEYYSEDPYLSGMISSEMVRAVEAEGITTTIKHFVGNERETARNTYDARMSERALREIYLVPFEMAVNAGVSSIMTSYNLLNGTETSENIELLRGILRGEFGFDGVIATDWTNNSNLVLEILAGNNIKNSSKEDNLSTAGLAAAVKNGKVSRSLLIENATYVMKLLLKLPDGKNLAAPVVTKISATGKSKIEAEDFFLKHSYARLEKSGSRTALSYARGTDKYVPYVAYKLNVEKAGRYILSVEMANNATPAYDAVTVFVNGREQQVTYNATPTGGWMTFAQREIGKVTLPAGEVELKIRTNAEKCPGNYDYFLLRPLEETYTAISSAEDLLELMNNTAKWNGKYFLTEDIDLSTYGGTLIQKPIGTNAVNFTGTFDGMGHSIKGISLSTSTEKDFGLFGKIKGAVIRDLTVFGSVNSTSPNGVVGGIVGTADPGSMMSGCENHCTVSYANVASPAKGVGGVCAYLYSGAANDGSVIKHSKNYGSVTSETGENLSAVGGVVGCMNNAGAGVSFVYVCENFGSISGSGAAVGGIVGSMTQSAVGGGNNVVTCANYGSITADAGRAGGIIGVCTSTASTAKTHIEYCANYGVVGAGTGHESGGIVGLLEGGNLSDCYNGGSVSAKDNLSVGGIVGRAYASLSAQRYTLQRCYTLDGAQSVIAENASDKAYTVTSCGVVNIAEILAGRVGMKLGSNGYIIASDGPRLMQFDTNMARGDVDASGKTTVLDIMICIYAYLNNKQPVNIFAVDFDGDGKIGIPDIQILLKWCCYANAAN